MTAFLATLVELVAIAPTGAYATFAVSLLLSTTAKGDINFAVSAAGGGGITTEDAESASLAFNCFTFLQWKQEEELVPLPQPLASSIFLEWKKQFPKVLIVD